ncbi:MAG: carboxypeptidase regulatory-like domain-containing protein, partial [Bacillus sp. (in: firmicutes)]
EAYSEGDEVTYKLNISNLSDLIANNVVVTSTIPEGLTLISQDLKVEGNKIVWNIDKINPAAKANLEFKAKLPVPTTPVTPPPTEVDDTITLPVVTPVTVKPTATVAPETGDDTNLVGYYILLGLSAGVLTIGIRGLRKKSIKKELIALLALALLLPSASAPKAETQAEPQLATASVSHKLVVHNKEFVVQATVEATMEEPPAPGTISGTITNAIDGEGVEGLTLKFREGENNTTGEVVGTVTTNEEGSYEIELLEGTYTIEISGDGFITTTKVIQVIGKQSIGDLNAAVSPVFGEGLRIVLTWGGNPEDLDSHLNGPTADGDRFVVYYSNQSYSDELNEIILDEDDTDSYGPETVTVIKHISDGIY